MDCFYYGKAHPWTTKLKVLGSCDLKELEPDHATSFLLRCQACRGSQIMEIEGVNIVIGEEIRLLQILEAE